MTTDAQENIRILPKKLLAYGSNLLNGLASLLIILKFTPNSITILALLIGAGAGALFAFGYPLWGGIAIILCGIFDVMDGKVAVRTNRKTLFGAIFDSTLDRYSEFFIYLGLAYYLRDHWALWIIFFTFLGSTMVSYTRARAEGLGFECKIGIMQRAERMVLLTLGAILGSIFKVFDPVIIIVLGLIALVSNITALQRTLYVKKLETKEKTGKEAKSNG
ncbi:MAG: CDP-alcohol phosphatidyltransferase family protein [Candidatus Aminicenantes bacterium]|nr:CDP-alcohol phosphatidyltransferase family protein [Candidatus Aminicenantes bacterium]